MNDEPKAVVFWHSEPISDEIPASGAHAWLMVNQDNSVDYALTDGGYDIRVKGEYNGVCFTPGCMRRATQVSPFESRHMADTSHRYRCDECCDAIGNWMMHGRTDPLTTEKYREWVAGILSLNVDKLRPSA